MALKLAFNGVSDRGNLDLERIHLVANEAASLMYYVLFASIRRNAGFYRFSKDAYWFPTREVKEGDGVIVYTKKGVDTSQQRSDGGTDHFLFWNNAAPLWTLPDSCPVLIQVATWMAGPAEVPAPTLTVTSDGTGEASPQTQPTTNQE